MSLHYWETTLPAVRDTLGDMVAAHKRKLEGLREVWECIQRNLEAVADVQIKNGSYSRGLSFDLEIEERRLCAGAWKALLDRLNLEYALSGKRMDEVREQIEKRDTPEFTESNIVAMIESLSVGLPEYFRESCREVLDWIRPWRDDYATNKRNATNEIGARVIKGWVVDNWGYGFNLKYDKEQKLRSLDNVFSLLDGAGVQRYPGDLVTAIKGAMQAGRDSVETARFHCRWFKNGNIHIEFLRSDLLAEFNAICHGNTLRNPFSPKPDTKGPIQKKREKEYSRGQKSKRNHSAGNQTETTTPPVNNFVNDVTIAISEIIQERKSHVTASA